MKLFNKYKFSDKRQSLGGIISTIMGLLALASLIYGVYISFKAEGYAGLKVGSLGLLSLLISVIGTFIGLLSASPVSLPASTVTSSFTARPKNHNPPSRGIFLLRKAITSAPSG